MGTPLSGLSAFLLEQRRRKVVRVAVVYAVVACAVIQIATTVFPNLRLPEWLVTAVIVLPAHGFAVVLALAWAFDVTPEGVSRTDSPPAASPRHWRFAGGG